MYRLTLGWAMLLPALAAAGGDATPPKPGRYAGELCVSTAGAATQCGAAELEFSRGAVRVRVSDIVYRLQLRSSQAQVQLFHGRMQIDEFVADYQWAPEGLLFRDADKEVRFDVRWRAPVRR